MSTERDKLVEEITEAEQKRIAARQQQIDARRRSNEAWRQEAEARQQEIEAEKLTNTARQALADYDAVHQTANICIRDATRQGGKGEA